MTKTESESKFYCDMVVGSGRCPLKLCGLCADRALPYLRYRGKIYLKNNYNVSSKFPFTEAVLFNGEKNEIGRVKKGRYIEKQ